MFDLEQKTVKQRNKIDALQQENTELNEVIKINSRFNKLSLKERLNVSLDIQEINNKLGNIDKRVKELEKKPRKKRLFNLIED